MNNTTGTREGLDINRGSLMGFNPEYQPCIDQCNRCADSCYKCFNACLNEPDLNDRSDCIRTLVECAMMCHTAASMMSMNSRYSRQMCQMCGDICEECAKECSMMKDDHCQACADSCGSCATECHRMASL